MTITIAKRAASVSRVFAVESPDFKTVAAALATIGMVAQYFGITAPSIKRADMNRDGRWQVIDQLKACDSERRELTARLLIP